MMLHTNFTPIDWVIVVLYLCATGLLGAYVNRHIHTASHYLVGSRSAPTALSTASFIGTGLGLVTLMYASMDGFNKGFSYLFVPVLGMIVPFILGITGFVIQRLREMELSTIPEFFHHRFNRRAQVTAGLICTIAGVLNMGLFPKMGATFITYVTGMGNTADDASMTVNIITSLLIVLVLAYTILGGMVAVLVTDYIQFVVLSFGLAIGTWLCLNSPEIGWDNMVSTVATHQGEAAFNPFHPESYGWTYIIWMTWVTTAAGICWVPEATRALTTQDPHTTKRTFLLGSPGFFARMAIPALWGIAAFTYIQNHESFSVFFSSEALEAHPGRSAAAMPLLIGNLIPTGLLGLLTAGLIAAFMSTHDSYLLAWGSVISQDVIAPLTTEKRLSDAQSIRFTRISVLVIGLFLLVWGIWYELPESVWTYMAVTGTVYLSGTGTALIGGMYWKGASSTGATGAMLGGTFAIAGLFPQWIQQTLADLFNSDVSSVSNYVNEPSIALFVFFTCVTIFIAGSLIFPDKQPAS
ncbi:MAG: sodium:solute symporter family protein [Planctomycetota bacterium]|nr:sodium:solute symporter family protein [Planctomycetota bacterium]